MSTKPMKYSKGEFTTVPNKSARRGLPPNEQVVLMWLADHSDDDAMCYPTRKTLADECGITVRTLDRALASLVDRGLIAKSARYDQNRQTSNMYEVVIVAPPYADIAQGGDKNDTGRATKTARGRATKTTHRTQPIRNSTQLTQVDTVVSTPMAAEFGNQAINEMFAEWEQAVGYKIQSQMQKNRNACNNLLKRHGDDGLKRLIQGVARAQGDRYAPRISDFITLQAKFNDLLAWGRQQTSGVKVADL